MNNAKHKLFITFDKTWNSKYILCVRVMKKKEKAIVKAMQDHVNEINDFEIAILDAKDNRVIN